jgi:hypothetical protein
VRVEESKQDVRINKENRDWRLQYSGGRILKPEFDPNFTASHGLSGRAGLNMT